MRKHLALLLSAFSTALAVPASAQLPPSYSRVKINTLQEQWVDAADGQPQCNVISLNKGTFRDQSLGNPHVQYTDGPNVDWLLMCWGDHQLGDTSVQDAIYMVRRRSLDGQIEVRNNPPNVTPVLAYPSGVGAHLGVGAAIAKSKEATTIGGRKYFALVPVGDPATNKSWITWAASVDGMNWKFRDNNGGETADPRLSMKLIRDYYDTGFPFLHPAMVYIKRTTSDPGNFYANIGWQRPGQPGIYGTWWRIPFDKNEPSGWGLKWNGSFGGGEFEAYRWDSSAIPTSSYVLEDPCPLPVTAKSGICSPESVAWLSRASEPSGVADPMDLIAFETPNGLIDHVLLFYHSAERYGSQPTPIRYVKGGPPGTNSNFAWEPSSYKLDTSILWDRAAFPSGGVHCANQLGYVGTYSPCGASGGYFLSANYSGTLFGYVSTWRSDKRQDYQSGTGCNLQSPGQSESCQYQVQGLLPFTFKLQNMGVDGINPKSGPRGGGTPVTVSGAGFSGTPTVDLGGSFLMGVARPNSATLTGNTAPHAAGVSYLRVTNPNPTPDSDLIANAYVYDFDDVPAGHPYHDDVVKMARNRITAGCGGNNYCPDSPVTRAQMAVFLLTGRAGHGYIPPLQYNGYFADVGQTDFAVDWIEQLFRLGITGGCGLTGATCNPPVPSPAIYCPTTSIPREQMAVFLWGAAGRPSLPACTQIFNDVPCSSGYAKFINYAASQPQGWMPACGPGTFCPSAPVLRKEMAQHISKAFNLP